MYTQSLQAGYFRIEQRPPKVLENWEHDNQLPFRSYNLSYQMQLQIEDEYYKNGENAQIRKI